MDSLLKKNTCRIAAALVIGMIFITASCTKKNKTGNLEREDLFTIVYGSFENQLNLLNLESPYPRPDSQIYMDEGIFYISNAYSGKILQLTSFGDLLSLYYNPDKNPPPTFTGSEQNQKITTRRSIIYPFNHPSYLTVTKEKHLFAVDTIPDDRIEYDYTDTIALRNIVVHFDETGAFVDTIGQEGVGGTPFPLIEGLFSNDNNELIVVCKTAQSMKVYWYDAAGTLRYKIPIALDKLPSPYESSITIFSNIEKIVPDHIEEKIYLKIDYYREDIDPATKVSAGISYDKSCLYVFDIASKQYEHPFEIAPYETSETAGSSTVYFKKVYNLLGVSQQNWCFLSVPDTEGYILKIIDLRTGKMYTRKLLVAAEELLYNAFSLSPDGILSALLAGNDSASLVWWRTNEIIGAYLNER